jgi:hypothetical protein
VPSVALGRRDASRQLQSPRRSAQALAMASTSGQPIQDPGNATSYRYYYHYTNGPAQISCTRKVVVQFRANQ